MLLRSTKPRMTVARVPISSTPPPWRTWRLEPPTAAPSTSVMLAAQESLPRLPVLKLDDTVKRALLSAKAVAESENEYKELERKAADFTSSSGIGPVLQTRLEKRREKADVPNWIAEWWDTDAYMAYRDSVVVNVTYYYGFDRLPQGPQGSTPPGEDPAYVAATLASTALEFKRLVAQGLLEPDKAGKDALCMESFKWAYNACRVPASPSDYAVKIPEDAEEAQTFVVIYKNNFWKVATTSRDGSPATVQELKRAFEAIYAEEKPAAPGVGVLTGINRDHWTTAHTHLLKSSTNAATLTAIRDASFVICLDESTPSSKGDDALAEFSSLIWKGDKEGSNRWWDKPLQWIVFRNGESGFLGEHSCMDGTPTARMNDFMSKRLLTHKPSSVGAGERDSSTVPTITSLPFELDSTSLQHIEDGKAEFAKHVGQYKLFYKKFGQYGKDGIKAMKTSPDGWVQMMFQLAYYLTFQKPCGTYEAAQVRRFALGRTETVRTATVASGEFTKAMVDPKVSNAERAKLFQTAVAQQGADVKLASSAQGIDRHLFGLKHLVEEGESAPFLTDKLLARSGTWNMSTSQIYIKHAPAYGWGPVVNDGFGIPYMIHEDNLQFTVTCHQDMPGERFLANLVKAGEMIMETMQDASKAAKL